MNGTVGGAGTTHQMGQMMKAGQSALGHATLQAGKVNDPNATRQDVIMETDEYGSLRVSGIASSVKQATVEKIFTTTSEREKAVVESNMSQRVAESIANKDHNMATIYGKLGAAIHGAMSGELTSKESLLSAAHQLSERLDQDTRTIQQERTTADRNIAEDVARFNGLLSEINDLNQRIQQTTRGDNKPASVYNLEDRRRAILNDMRELMNFDIDRVELRESNVVLISVPGTGHKLLDDSVHPLVFTAAPQQVIANMTLGNGLSHIQTEDGIDITDKITSGSIAGNLSIRDVRGPAQQTDLDAWGRQLYDRFNQLHNTGSPYPPPTSVAGVHTHDATQNVTIAGNCYVTLVSSEGKYVDRVQLAPGTKTIEQVRAEIDAHGALTATLVGNAPAQTLTITASGGQKVVMGGDGTIVGDGVVTPTNFSHFFGLNNLFTLKMGGSPADAGVAGLIQVRPTLTSKSLSLGSIDTTITTLGQSVMGPQRCDVAQALYAEFTDQGTTFSMGTPAATATLKGHLVSFMERLVTEAQRDQSEALNASAKADAYREQFLAESGVDLQESFLKSQDYLAFLETLAKMLDMIRESHQAVLNAL